MAPHLHHQKRGWPRIRRSGALDPQAAGRGLNALLASQTRWGLEKPELLTTTPSCHVYRVLFQGAPAVLKLFSPTETSSTLALSYFDGRGCVRLFDAAEGAQLLEFVEGPDLVSLVRAGQDESATLAMLSILQQIHAAPLDAPPALVNLEQHFHSLLTYKGGNSMVAAAAGVTRELLQSPAKEYVLHGDLHHANVLRHPARGRIAIDPKGLRGDRAFDAVNILYNPLAMPELVANRARIERHCALIEECMQIDRQRLRKFAFAYGALSACWSVEDGQSPDHALRVAELCRQLQ